MSELAPYSIPCALALSGLLSAFRWVGSQTEFPGVTVSAIVRNDPHIKTEDPKGTGRRFLATWDVPRSTNMLNFFRTLTLALDTT